MTDFDDLLVIGAGPVGQIAGIPQQDDSTTTPTGHVIDHGCALLSAYAMRGIPTRDELQPGCPHGRRRSMR
jgi:hypothetical protein